MARVVKTRTEMEGRLSERWVVVEGPEPEVWPQDAKLEVVGLPAPRVDGFERVTGRATYTHDIQLPGMLHGRILRSPFPHAALKAIDVSRAELLPGVRALLTPGNCPAVRWKDGRPLLGTDLWFTGDEVAVVAAEDEQTAEDALDLIQVRYEELPFVQDPERALDPGAPRVHPEGNLMGGKPRVYHRGNLDQGWAEAEVVVEETFRTQTAVHNPLEPHGSVARWIGDELTVWDSTQHVHGVRSELAAILGLPLHKIRVLCHYMGGGFGNKQEMSKQTVLAALLSRMSGRPVKIMLDRHEESIATGHRHPTTQRVKLGARKDGTLTAIYHHSIVPAGVDGYASSTDGPSRKLYLCPNVHTELYGVRTNHEPARAFRGPGYAEGMFALESAVDMLAERLGMDPLELRLKNYADTDQTSGEEYSAKGLRQAYLLAAEKIGWSARPGMGGTPPGGAGNPGNRRRGIGMASQIWGGGGGPPAYAVIKVNPDGTAEVITGSQDIGTGSRTGLTQVAAEALGIPLSRVRTAMGDTEGGPYSPVSAGSMTLSSVGPAVRAAAVDARNQLVEMAAHLLEVPRERVEVKDGFVYNSGSPETRKPISEVLRSFGDAMIVGRGSRGPNPEGLAVNTFGAQFAEVEVDLELGRIRVLSMVAVHDFGRVINPRLVQSQLEGGVIQGVGFALMEERVVDSRTGRVLNPNLEEYLIPTAPDVPEIDAGALNEADLQSNNLGAKGVGEPPLIPTAPAIANAVCNATGIRLTSLPMSVHQLLAAVRKGGNP